ncbi:MAG: ABC transporter ATP-binding protein [Nitrospinota bacterium]
MLKLHDVSVFYGEVQALWDVSFHVEEGEVAALIGSNGAGKTTTLRTVGGLLHPKTGAIQFEGRAIERMPAHMVVALGISQIPEGRRLFPRMSVLENLELGAYPAKARSHKEESLERVFRLFSRLDERRHQPVGTMSGGEQQMVAIGRSLMSRPKLLLVDEPSLGLAPNLVQEVFEVIEVINREGVTVLLVEQNVRRALEITDRAYVLESGRLTRQGTGKNMLEDDYVRRAYLGL